MKNYVRKRRLSVTDTMNQSPQVKVSPSNFPLKQHNQKHILRAKIMKRVAYKPVSIVLSHTTCPVLAFLTHM